MTVIVKDRGARALVASLARVKPSSVKVGVLAKEGGITHGDDNITVAVLAAVHEFGLGVPQRSWLRGFVDENRAEIEKVMRKVARQVALGVPRRQALSLLGVWLQGAMQKRIADGIDPPNAASTIAAKGSSTPLIDTGQLRSSITYEVE